MQHSKTSVAFTVQWLYSSASIDRACTAYYINVFTGLSCLAPCFRRANAQKRGPNSFFSPSRVTTARFAFHSKCIHSRLYKYKGSCIHTFFVGSFFSVRALKCRCIRVSIIITALRNSVLCSLPRLTPESAEKQLAQSMEDAIFPRVSIRLR